MQIDSQPSPLVVGGMGGSGTRLVAGLLHSAGYYLGDDLNPALDNLWFSLLFKRPEILTLPDEEFSALLRLFLQRMLDGTVDDAAFSSLSKQLTAKARMQHAIPWLQARAASFSVGALREHPPMSWGWKEPNTHIILDRLFAHLPSMKYIHVARNGLDMAFSENQYQLLNWGELILGRKTEYTPENSLRYWCTMHQRILKTGALMGKNQFFWLNYDDLCLNPAQQLTKLLEFIGETGVSAESLVEQVRRPSTMGRFRQNGAVHFPDQLVSYVEQLGFSTT